MDFNLTLSEYDYKLPEEKIALRQLPSRDQSKLLICNVISSNIEHKKFKDIIHYLKKDDLIVVNNSKVIPARLFMQKRTGGKCEILLLEPYSNKILNCENEIENTKVWNCLIGGKNIKKGDKLSPLENHANLHLEARILAKNANEAIVEFEYQPENIPFIKVLDLFGITPLPPYIKREAEEIDKYNYQTVYAKLAGSVAAPTAGLHFTKKILNKLKENGINILELTLHVGAGTFIPIKNDDPIKHNMHNETFSVSLKTIEKILNHLKNKIGRVIAVGTTAVRTLESLYWLGTELLISKTNPQKIEIEQWCWNKLTNTEIPVFEAFQAVYDWTIKQNYNSIAGKTALYIIPGYDFKVIDAMITNFHLPKSTLILLVAAFTGKNLWRKIYDEALNNDYRFLSYGDSSFLYK